MIACTVIPIYADMCGNEGVDRRYCEGMMTESKNELQTFLYTSSMIIRN